MAAVILQHEIKPFEWDTINQVAIPSIEERFTCPECGKEHPDLFMIVRKVSKPFGHFMAFHINGEWQVVDPTLPHTVNKVPRDAIRVPDDIAGASWHGTGHYMYLRKPGGGRMTMNELREAVK